MRLIVIPQYPTELRYQEWWILRFEEYRRHFDEVVILNPKFSYQPPPTGEFAPSQESIEYELLQIQMYNQMELRRDDVLLVCDLSFPGLFSSVLYHKRPSKCFAICHATSINRYDYFCKDRSSKWQVEVGFSRLFNSIFVASSYHALRLSWGNVKVIKFPLPRLNELILSRIGKEQQHIRPFVSVARPGPQKVDLILESEFERVVNLKIFRFHQTKGRKIWTDYYGFVESGKFLIVSSREETYGYQIIDALSVGTIPLAPHGLSYPEILPKEYLYELGNLDSLVEAYRRNVDSVAPPLWKDSFIDFTSKEMHQ